MVIEPVGDSLLIVRDFPGQAWSLANWIQNQNVPGVIETVPAYNTIGIIIDPLNQPDIQTLLTLVQPPAQTNPERMATIRICFELGEDFQSTAHSLKLPPEELALKFTTHTFDCYAVGFQPGFPYLGWLPPELQGLERLALPRKRVPAGSVAIVGSQAGIYPHESPGGWHLIGRTPDQMVDLDAKTTFLLPGDKVQFVRIDPKEFEASI